MNHRQNHGDAPSGNGHGSARPEQRPALITGGAGFVGTNVADRLAASGQRVLVFDNLSRSGVERNLQWLQDTHGDLIEPIIADVRDAAALQNAVARAVRVFHFAAQVAVTTSLDDPRTDFEVNTLGTLNLLEAIRAQPAPPPLVFTSTNKVYGGMEDVEMRLGARGYEPEDARLRANGVGEDRPLDFHSPYGCSKGAADQYVLDYARTYGIPAVVFRMSCIYGPHQFGNEDQGWVAHFLIRALEGKPITLYGDGQQVRDILYVDDLTDAFLRAHERISEFSGQAFNIGGGPRNTVSLLGLLDRIGDLHGEKLRVRFDDWRPGDQRYYVSNTAKFQKAAGWMPRVDASTGVDRLYTWLLSANRAAARPMAEAAP